MKSYLEAKNRDGDDIKLLPDVINLLGIGWDVFEKGDATFPTLIGQTLNEFFKDIKEIEPEVRESNYHSGGIANVLEIRRFELRIPGYFEGTEEDPERVLQASYFKDTNMKWVFRLDAYKELYEGTPAENWIDW